jgi:hypothetical protein
MRLLLPFCLCLCSAGAFAQTTVSGRVLDAKTGDGLPGATVLQTGTANGVSSDAEGRFKLTVAGQPDSVALTISSIGYTTVQPVVAPRGELLFRLLLKPVTLCDLRVFYRFRVSLIGGLRYTPEGGGVTFTHPRVLHSQLSATTSYRTDFSRNHLMMVSVGLPSIRRYRRISFSESVTYTKSHVPSANIFFESGEMLVGVHSGVDRWPSVYGGLAFGRQRAFLPESFASSTGVNYALGLGHRLPLGFYATAYATRWPNAWQWQGSLSRDLPFGLYTSLSLNHLRSYQEISITLSRTFY